MGWVDPVDILLFSDNCQAWYLEMWIDDDALYVNLRYLLLMMTFTSLTNLKKNSKTYVFSARLAKHVL